MSEIKILQQDIERLHRRVSQRSDLLLNEIWDMYEEWDFLRNNLNEQLLGLDKTSLSIILQPLLEIHNTLQDEILQRSDQDKQDIYNWTEKRVQKLEEFARDLLGDVIKLPIVVAMNLLSLSQELLFLKRIVKLLDTQKNESLLPDIINEIYYLVAQSHETKSLLHDPFLSEQLAVIRDKALGKEVTFFDLETSSALTREDTKVRKVWETLLWGNDIQPNISQSQESHRPMLEICLEKRKHLRHKLETLLKALPQGERLQELEYFAIDVQDAIDDVLVGSEEKILRIAIKSLEVICEENEWLLQFIKKQITQIPKKEIPSSLSKHYRKLKSKNRSLGREIQDKKIQHRMEGIFGERFVNFFEKTVLFLILMVIVLLVAEETMELSNQTRHNLMLIDTGICAILLIEFFGKLSLARGKLMYFWRHWFTDFLPSLPFGLVAHIYGEHITRIHILRGVRLIRLIRFIRIFRVFTFLLRGSDRLVRHYGRWLNRNIVFFGSAEEVKNRRQPTLIDYVQDLRGLSLNRSRMIFRRVHDREAKINFIAAYIKILDVQMDIINHSGNFIKQRNTKATPILAEDVIHTLLNLRGPEVENIMGREFPSSLYQYLKVFNTPVLRRFPGIHRLVAKHEELEPTEFTAWLGRNVGRVLERCLSVVYWFVDLYGVINPPRVLDRIGNALVNSFQRPAKKLMFLGGFVIFMDLLFQAFPLPIIQQSLDFLEKFVGVPLIVIGGVCIIPVLLGWWLKSIAGEATDFFLRTSEAQFINLLEDVKLITAQEDMEFLYERVLKPELALVWGGRAYPSAHTIIQKWKKEVFSWDNDKSDSIAAMQLTTRQKVREWNRQRQVLLIYRDYLDGSPLHRSDVKTTEQLLGNIAIDNIRTHRLNYSKKELKKLEKLDLENNRSFFGPYLWFSFITQSISHNTARLLVDYNKYCLPEPLIELQSEEKVSEYREWLDHRLHGKAPQKKKKEKNKKRGSVDTHPLYMTTRFTALHFLTIDKEQDENIRVTFGDSLYKALEKDRRQLIRHIFSTYPLHEWPQAQRTINPYELYQTYMAGGQVLLLPARLTLKFFGLIGLALKWLAQKIHEILNPELGVDMESSDPDFNVMARKINRMRKPAYIECMKLRARFDFEYLGLKLQETEGLGEGSREEHKVTGQNWLGPFEEDLEFIQALDYERDYFYSLYRQRKNGLKSFHSFIKERNWKGEAFLEYLASIDATLPPRSGEIMRALALAYTIDYKELPSFLNATEVLQNAFNEAIDGVRKLSFHDRFFVLGPNKIKEILFGKSNRERKDFNKFWQSHYENYSEQEKKIAWHTYLKGRKNLRPALTFMSVGGDFAGAEKILQQIIRNPTPWTEELIAIRTVQTLAILDVSNYQKHISRLGEYSEREGIIDKREKKEASSESPEKATETL